MTDALSSMVILGGGPAASTLGTLMARAGHDVWMFHRERDRSTLVGESLVPGVVPILRELGVEEAVSGFSRRKPGAAFWLDGENRFEFLFEEVPGPLPGYAYNVPRWEFNRALRRAAREAGVTVLDRHAGITADGPDRPVRLEPESLAALEGLDGRPDLIVDATGRARLLARKMGLPTREGSRRDTALFTHFDRTRDTRSGIVYTDVLDYGWTWRIPLPDRVSFGAVMDTDYLAQFGDDPAEQLEGLRRTSERIGWLTEPSERLEPVRSFSNYQLVTERLTGRNWVLLGDAAGFVDPVFATGVYLAMDAARDLAGRLRDRGTDGLTGWADRYRDTLEAWTAIVETFYDGRLMTLLKTGRQVQDSLLGRLLNPHMAKHMGRIFTGLAGESPYSRWLLWFMTRYGLADNDPDEHRIRSGSDEG